MDTKAIKRTALALLCTASLTIAYAQKQETQQLSKAANRGCRNQAALRDAQGASSRKASRTGNNENQR